MQLYNSLTREVEEFKPLRDKVTVYVCGITPYDTTHLGHAFTYTSADILIRYLEASGYKVLYVQNVTDIDDDILRKAKEVEESWEEVGNRWTAHFIRDMIALNARPPDYYPRATDVIPEIIETVRKLLASGVAYESEGNVYFDIDAWPRFGELSALDREEMLPIANERGNRPDDPHKRNPLDFVLWQAQAPGEPGWDSPWGMGRPGWHIECSTMSTKYLGSPVDIHSGGADLCFPHHECEIAQIEPINDGHSFVRLWMHVAMVYFEGEKMSKSLGNLVMVRDLLRDHSSDALRILLGSHHYREIWSFTDGELVLAQEKADLIHSAIHMTGGIGAAVDPEPQARAFAEAMEADLNTQAAVEAMVYLAENISAGAASKRSVESAQSILRSMGSIFGLQFGAGPESRVEEGWNEHLERFPVSTIEQG